MKNMKTLLVIISFLGIFSVTARGQAKIDVDAFVEGEVTGDSTVEADASLLAEIDEIGKNAMESDPGKETDAFAAENTLGACRDNIDNDRDSHVDCDDQDCGIFAICVAAEKTGHSSGQADAESSGTEGDTVEIFERGRMCRDGIDNDNNGTTDCHDPKCQSTRYCKKEMYEYPYNPMRAPGIFFQAGFGLALPNCNWKDVRVNSQYGDRIPFDPDVGGMLNFKVGVLPIPWIGVGMNVNIGGTFASNREEFISISDLDSDYKYDGYKVFGHIGAFIRLQYPTRRFTVYMDVAGGSSHARYKWRVYDGDTSWSDISGDWDDDDWDDLDRNTGDIERDSRYKQAHHFSLVLEPGFDFFVVERKVGIGMHAWIPVYASSNEGMDNIGIMFNTTFTPTWREPRRLKDEYK